MKEWVQKAVANGLFEFVLTKIFALMTSLCLGKQVDGGAPSIAVYPDDSKDGFPHLPNFAGAKLVEAQKLLRVYITMIWSRFFLIIIVPRSNLLSDAN